jgi:fructose-specific PTS system IIA-like component
VEEILSARGWRRSEAARVVDADTIDVSSDARTKEEAIRDAVDLLFVAGRTDRPGVVEEAVWAREETYSTGLGFGFAVPHCKTSAVSSPTLAVLKLSSPVEWGSMDGQPVRMVLLLTIPESDTTGAHMKVFAKLARKLMHEEFRERMLGATDRAEIEACLNEELGLGQEPRDGTVPP